MRSLFANNAAAVFLIAVTAQARDSFPPLNFELNQGQAAASVRFVARTPRYNLLLSDRQVTISSAQHSSLQMSFTGARTADAVVGDELLLGKVNYFIGNDPKRWQRSVPTFAKVHYRNLYPGIDLVFYGNQRRLEYDFIVAPGVDVHAIRLAFSAAATSFEKNGDLLCQISDREFRLHKPVFYQAAGLWREPVDGRFVKLPHGEIGFAAGTYDHTRPLIIDPVVEYSSYLGGSDDEGIWAIQRDAAGNLYMAGEVTSADFPVAGPVQANVHGNYDGFISKFDPSGTQLIYSTYLGGSKFENIDSMAVDADGSAYVGGRTTSADYPTFQAIQPSFAGATDGFIARLDPSGSQLIFSTYWGGSQFDAITGIALGPNNAVYVTGQTRSYEFPVTDGAYQTTCDTKYHAWACAGDAFVSKLDSTGATLIYSTFLGGSSSDSASGIAVDPQGNIYVSGSTSSSDFPVAQAYQGKRNGFGDAFLTKISPDGKSLVFSTYFGGSVSGGSQGLAIDQFQNSYLIGTTNSNDLPTVSPFQAHMGGLGDGFIAKFDSAGQAVYASYLGGNKFDLPFRVAVDSSGSAVVAGFTQSSDFPVLNATQPSFGGGLWDAFVTKIAPDGSSLVYSTYLGGAGDEFLYALYNDEAGNIWVGGSTSSRDFPIVNAFQGAYAGGPYDAFFTKISANSAQLTRK
jgi:hypothetical protein